MGYVLVKGKKGEKVADTTTVFASPACHRVLRRGKNAPPPKKVAVNKKEIEAEVRRQLADAKPDVSQLGIIGSAADSIIKMDGQTSEAVVSSNTKEAVTKALEKQTAGFSQDSVVIEETETESFFKKKLEDLNAATEKLQNMSFNTSTVAGLAAWFDDMEAVIDSLPTMSEDGGTVYIVEKNEKSEWIYTGDSQPMDREWNAKLQGAKASVCMWLQKQTDKLTAEMESKLQDLLSRLDTCGPFTKVITAITSVPSLTTIIDWAKGIIDFVLGIYKLILSIYQMTMQLLELIIVRFPQLVNKVMNKITEYNCPISARVTINVKSKNGK